MLEDAHWIDPTTLELMTRLADSISQARLLALVTARPDFAAPWLTRPQATVLTLNCLSRAECARLVANVAAAHGLQAETVAAIVAKTDGVPLFVEELTKSVVESAGEDSAAVPATLKPLLMARLDRLDEAREVAQIAAVIGRQFAFSVLAAIAARDGAAPMRRSTSWSRRASSFPRDAAWNEASASSTGCCAMPPMRVCSSAAGVNGMSALRARLSRDSPEAAANEPELLAYHFAEAGLAAPACDYRMRAGDRAVSRSAYQEAVAHFSAGLKLADALPDPADRKRRALDFLLKLGPALMVTRGLQSAEVEDPLGRAAEIGERSGDSTALYKAKWGLWLNANIRRKTELARDRPTSW